jgi:curved DNA-binding protein CbpA
MTYYDELGVSRDATNEEIRAAFRRKAKEHHPDRGGDPEKMSAANRAYETLISPDRRLTYDRTGDDRPPQTDNAAQQLVLATILEWMASATNSGDLITDVSARFDSDDRATRDQIDAGNKHLDRLRKRLKKLKFKGKGADFVRQAVAHKIKETKQQIEKLKDRRQMLARAKEILGNYEYEVEAAPQTFTFGIITAPGTSP